MLTTGECESSFRWREWRPSATGALFCSCGARPKSALHRAVDESRRVSRLTPLSTSPLTLGDVRGVQPHGGEAVAGVWYANVGVLAGPAQATVSMCSSPSCSDRIRAVTGTG